MLCQLYLNKIRFELKNKNLKKKKPHMIECLDWSPFEHVVSYRQSL